MKPRIGPVEPFDRGLEEIFEGNALLNASVEVRDELIHGHGLFILMGPR